MSPVATPSPTTLSARKGLERSTTHASRWQLRLVIAVPVFMVLVSLAYGLISYLAFNDHWDEFEKIGAVELASGLLRTHMAAMLVLTLAAALMGLILARTILRPINAILEATRLITRGQLDQRAAARPAAQELDDLSTSFNAMIEKLNQAIAERHRSLMAGIPSGVLLVDPSGRVSALSPAAAELLGAPADDLIGLPVEALDEHLPASAHHLAAYLAAYTRPARQHETQDNLVSGPHPGQELIVTASSLQSPGGSMPLGTMFSFREAKRTPDPDNQQARADQLAALGTFTLGLAHELRNPLGAIKGLSQLLLLERGLPESAGDFLRRMAQEVDRVDRFVRQLFELTEQPPASLAPADLAQLMRHAAERVRHELPLERVSAIEVRLELAPLPPRLLEADRLTDALARIIQNAYEATPPGGRITLATREETQDGHLAAIAEVRNTGSTIEPGHLRKIFDPFFTTRDKAAGLGLSIANQIVMQNGGTIRLNVKPEEVAFIITLNQARMAPPSAGASRDREAGAPDQAIGGKREAL